MKLKAEMGAWSSVVGGGVLLIAEDGRMAGQIAFLCHDDALRDKATQEQLARLCCDAINGTRAPLSTAVLSELPEVKALVKAAESFYIDCEFDGHDGPLLSIAMVRSDGHSLHIEVDADARDPWVIANVLPIMHLHKATRTVRGTPQNEVGQVLRAFIGQCQSPTIIADSPVDIGRFCRAISTGPDGSWQSTGYTSMTFIVRNVDCYPTTLEGAVQHNAWWDAMALRAALADYRGGAK